MKKTIVYLLSVVNILGLVYLLGLGWYSRIASDDYSYLVVVHRDGFFGALKYWYFNLQGRVTAHSVIQCVLLFLYDNHINLIVYYAVITVLGIYAFFLLFKNAAFLKQVTVDNYLMLNMSCFAFVLSIYNNFELKSFYWITNSPMYTGGVVFFIIGCALILSKKDNWISYLFLAGCFFYTGASSENFASIAIFLLGGFILFNYSAIHKFSLIYFLNDGYTQKSIIAIIFCFISFVIMVKAPGNKVRLAISNKLYNGYETVPLALSKMPGHVIKFYIEILITLVAKLLLPLAAAPVFMYMGASMPTFKVNHPLQKLFIVIVLFIILLAFFIVPSVYAQASLGPMRQYTYLSFFITLLTIYVFVSLGNLRVLQDRVVSLLVVFSLLFYSFIYVHDAYKQIPGMRKYAYSEDSRLEKIAVLKASGTTGVVVLDSLYVPQYLSYTNIVRNEIKDKIEKHTSFRVPYESIQFEPLYYNEIGNDTSCYINSDMAKSLHLPFSFKVK